MELDITAPPEYTQRFVVWNKQGEDFRGQLVLMVGYCPDTLSYFNGLFMDALKSAPEIEPDKAICTRVKKSSSVQGFTLMLIDLPGEKRPVPRFREVEWSSLDIQAY